MVEARVLRTFTVAFAVALFAAAAEPARAVVIYTVTNTNDGGAGSLRQAILDANASPGSDLIQFAIPGAGVHTILTFAPLPVTESILIDGYSQAGSLWNTNPFGDNAVIQIELFGQATDGLVLTGGATIVQGLSLYGFQTAISISGAFGSLIQGNFIGVSAGVQSQGNVTGVSITGTTGIDRIGDNYPAARNLISANATGILISGGGGKSVFGNLIGTDGSGGVAIPNGTGVQLTDSSNNLIGGGAVEKGNVISGNSTDGVHITGGAFNQLADNLIGTDSTGALPLGNGGNGVRVDGFVENLAIGGNTISGNAGDGIRLAYETVNPDTSLNGVRFNNIGSTFPGFLAVGNGGAGVRIESGGALSITENLITNNRVGVWRVAPSVDDTVIIRYNSIHTHRGLGIVMGPAEAITPNVPGSPFNYPLITSAVLGATDITIGGTYSGPASTTVSLDFFANPPCPAQRPPDFWEGRAFIGTLDVLTDGAGNASFNVTLPQAPGNDDVTATATIVTPQSARQGGALPTTQTSGFSQRLPFSIAPRSAAPGGGTPVTIRGTDFRPGAAVTIGGLAPANVVVVDATTITAEAPALPAGSASDVVVTNTDLTHGTIPLGWVADFLDVAPVHPFHDFVVALVGNAVASGVGGGNYGVGNATLRQQMAVFLLKAKHGICWGPPPCQSLFSDVPCPSTFADWIEALSQEGITGGCAPGIYCPTNPVLRQQMAVFLLKAKHGSAYVPPLCIGVFDDVPCPSPFADWIERLAAENITGGCGGENYCPTSSATRGQMAVFVTKTFKLQ